MTNEPMTEANKRLAAECLAAFSRGEIDAVAAMFTDDGVWRVMGKLEGMSGSYAMAEFVPLANSAREIYKDGALKITPSQMTAEDDRVAVIASGHAELKDGRVYCPDYHFLFTVRDGRIAELREFMDTLHAQDIFFAASNDGSSG